MTSPAIEGFVGTALVQRGHETLAAVAAGPDGAGGTLARGTRFQIASISKQFTAAAALCLVDRGALAVGDTIQRWLDGCPAHWDGITVHHLLTHTAGLVHWRDLPELDTTRAMSVDEELEYFRRAPLLFAPGTAYSYSSPGYVLLAHIIERCAAEPYGRFLETALFSPAGLTSTFAGNPDGRADIAVGLRGGVVQPSFDLDVVALGAGDLWSTVDDLARWSAALANGEVLSDDARRAMFSVQSPTTETHHFVSVEGYGYGTYLARVEGRRLIFHTGDNWGFQSFNGFLPDEDIRIAALTNDEETDLEPVVTWLYGLALG